MKVKKKKDISIFLPDIRSVYNVGAIFRTAEACGVNSVFLSGTTPTPIDRFGNLRKDFLKTSLGAERNVLWEYYKSSVRVINKFKKEGFFIVSVEQGENSIDYRKLKIKNKTLFIFGSETTGVSKNILKLSDAVCELPMVGNKESLNVSVCAGVVLYKFSFEN